MMAAVGERTFDSNDEAILAWNTVLFDKFMRFREVLTRGLSVHGDALIDRHPVGTGSHVLDVGCGFGDTTIALAKCAGPSGKATGVDAAARFIEAATAEARSRGADNAHYVVADVETEPVGGPYDRAFARFGTMFFARPVAAFRNVRRSLAKGSLFTMTVWRRKDENPWLCEVEQRVLEIVQPPEKTDDPTCGPGPFSQSSPDVTSAQLRAAGFDRIAFERFDTDICIGRDVDDAVAFAMALGPAGEILRLAGDEAEKHRPRIEAVLKEMLTSFARADGVYAGSSSWLVSARAA
jgi:ubiquinone/menaquinone biosynthesis C-methylase UbiE